MSDEMDGAMHRAAKVMLAALRKIADNYGGCHCDHTDESCCERTGEFCPHCIAEVAISEVGE